MIPEDSQHKAARMRHHRLTGWRYDCKCNYMITLVTSPRQSVFGELREWGVERNAEGKAVYDAWQMIEREFPGVRASYNAIIPDHFHGIVYISSDGAADLERVVEWFAAEVERKIGRQVWDPLWRDSICLARGQLDRQIKYVLSNPKRRWIKSNNPGLFRKLVGFRHWRVDAALAALAEFPEADSWDFLSFKSSAGAADRDYWEMENGAEIKRPRRANRIQPAFTDGQQAHDNKAAANSGIRAAGDSGQAAAGRYWSAVGNAFLLDEPMLISVRISRRTPPEALAEISEKIVAKAKRGAVLVGPWISPGEKAVKEAVAEAGGRIIQLIPEGMGRYYKPGGRDFDLCAEGRMLVISPFAPDPGGRVEREHYGKARFEWLNLAARSMSDFAMGWAPSSS